MNMSISNYFSIIHRLMYQAIQIIDKLIYYSRSTSAFTNTVRAHSVNYRNVDQLEDTIQSVAKTQDRVFFLHGKCFPSHGCALHFPRAIILVFIRAIIVNLRQNGKTVG